MTNKEAAAKCDEMASKIAGILVNVNDVKETAEFLQKEMDDNGDPVYDADTAVRDLGLLLADLICYRDEYKTNGK